MLDGVISILKRIGYDVIRGEDVEEFDFVYTRYALFAHDGQYNTSKRWKPNIMVTVITNDWQGG